MFGKWSQSGRKSPGRFMSKVNDGVYGAHFEGDDIVLSEEFGGHRFPSAPMGDRMPETPDGEFRLVLQDFSVKGGGMTGDPAVTVDTVPREVVESILGRPGLTGHLSAYTPRAEDARDAVQAATGMPAIPYSASLGITTRIFRNYRGAAPLREGDGMPGPVCLYGDEVVPNDMDVGWHIENTMGYHADADTGVFILAEDFGSLHLTMLEADACPEVPDGQFRAVLLPGPVADLIRELDLDSPGEIGVEISEEPIPVEIAVRICQDIRRIGALCVYTPRREDALELAASLFVDAKVCDVRLPEGAEELAAGCVGIRGKDSVHVLYGR